MRVAPAALPSPAAAGQHAAALGENGPERQPAGTPPVDQSPWLAIAIVTATHLCNLCIFRFMSSPVIITIDNLELL